MSKEVTIYGRPGCGYCVHAIALCEEKGFSFKYIDIYEENISKEELGKLLGHEVNTVPQILYGDDYIGGFTEFSKYVIDNQL